jgi:hypothetical protein
MDHLPKKVMQILLTNEKVLFLQLAMIDLYKKTLHFSSTQDGSLG